MGRPAGSTSFMEHIEPYPRRTEAELKAFLADWDASGAVKTGAYYYLKNQLASHHKLG